MKKARKTTLKERICIVKDCLDHDRNYGAMALKYDCSYQQIRNWVDRYEKIGSAGLEDRREYYNNRRLQRKLHIMTPMAFHELTLKAT